MIPIKSIRVLIFSYVIVVLCFHHVSAETLNRVVAIVNDEVITLHELNQKIKEMTGSTPEALRRQDLDGYLETRRMVLEYIIDTRIAQEKIRELGIKITPKQIDATIERIKKDNQWTHEDLMARLDGQGVTYEKYQESIKSDLERVKLINFEVKSKIIIREEQITQYYEKHKKEFGREEKVHVASIFLMQKNPGNENRELFKKGEDILARLKNGENFGDLAREFSQGPGANEGGDLGEFNTSQLDPELRKVLENMREGGFSDLIIRPGGIQIVQLIEKQGAEIKPLEKVRPAIYNILFREEVNKRYNQWIKKLREKSYTKTIF